MIYEVYLNNKLLYYPNDESYVILNSKLETALNEAGTFECDIPEDNMCYSDFQGGAQLRSGIITVLKNNVEIFCGEIRESTLNFDFTMHIYAVGELAYLFDSIQPQKKYQGTVEAVFSAILTQHNNQVEARKRFQKGNVLITDANNYIYHYTNREDTLTAIREKLCNTLNGYLKIRKANGVKYLDFIPLANYGRYCTQEIQFGENLLDYSQNYTANDIATCVIPLGVRLDDEDRTADAVEGLDEYLTIKGTTVDSYHTAKNNDYVYIQSAVNRFGWVRVVKEWDEVTVAETLKTKAENWLKEAQYAQMTLELSAIDLSLIDSDFDSFEVGDTVHCWAEPYGMDTTFPVQKKTIYLNDLSKNNITLSNTAPTKSYTSQQSDVVNSLLDMIPETSPILEEARNRALALLLDETMTGYVVYEYHYNAQGLADYITAINICNARSIEQSTKRWRWSSGGFGYMERTSSSAAWSTPKVAMTMNGEIVADMITTGLMSATRIRGGVLYLGGSGQGNYKNGSMYMYNGSDREIGHWNSSGISVKAGTVTLGNKTALVDGNNGVYIGSDGISLGANNTFKATSTGAVAASDLTITGGSIKLGGKQSYSDANEGLYLGSNGIALGASNTFSVDKKGKASATALSITGGSIKLGKQSLSDENEGVFLGTSGIGLGVDSPFRVQKTGKMRALDATIKGNVTATSGKIAGFTINGKKLQVGDSILSEGLIGCGEAGKGIVNMVGAKGSGIARYGYIQISNDGDPDECLNGLRIYGNGTVKHYDASGSEDWWFNLQTGEHG